MKIVEIIQEAHHSILKTISFDKWSVQIDSHMIASAADRKVSWIQLVDIISYACMMTDTFDTVPVGKGAFFQDTNTLISVYMHRLEDHVLRAETVLGSNMRPKPPLFRGAVPPSDIAPDPRVERAQAAMRDRIRTHGRDDVSQTLEKITPLLNLNRADRRALERKLKMKKL